MATPTRIPFTLRGADGGPLRGDLRTAGRDARPAVVIAHGFKGFKDWGFFPHLADRLARTGLMAVSFNFSGSGVGPDGEHFTEPERFGRATFGNDLADLATVVRASRDGGLAPEVPGAPAVGLFGHSRGGGMGVLYAASDPDLRALVTWSAIGSTMRWGAETVARWRADGRLTVVNQRTGEELPLYLDVLNELAADRTRRLDIGEAASRVACPWLLVHGAVDEAVPLREGEDLWERSGRRAAMVVIERGSHTFGARHPWAGMTPELERAFDETIAWFAGRMF